MKESSVNDKVKQTSDLTAPNYPTMSSVVVQVFSFGKLVAVSCQDPDGEIELVFKILVMLDDLLWLSVCEDLFKTCEFPLPQPEHMLYHGICSLDFIEKCLFGWQETRHLSGDGYWRRNVDFGY